LPAASVRRGKRGAGSTNSMRERGTIPRVEGQEKCHDIAGVCGVTTPGGRLSAREILLSLRKSPRVNVSSRAFCWISTNRESVFRRRGASHSPVQWWAHMGNRRVCASIGAVSRGGHRYLDRQGHRFSGSSPPTCFLSARSVPQRRPSDAAWVGSTCQSRGSRHSGNGLPVHT
jgi:hypothetical protein